MAVKEKVSKTPNLKDLVTSDTTFGEFEDIVGQFITKDNRDVLGIASKEKTARAILYTAKFGTIPFSAQIFGEEACFDPDNNIIRLPAEQVVEIIVIGKKMGLLGHVSNETMVNKNAGLTKNLQRILEERQKLALSISQ